MIPQWLIEKKRDGHPLTHQEIRDFITGYTKGDIPDYQMSALAMAIFFRGMTLEETWALTDVMMNSGDLVDTSSIEQPKLDKHSTGGIGDKVSLILAPLVACFDITVPMISGRGLGITGGTLDKLDSIPGYRSDLTEDEFLAALRECGCSIIGQTGDLAPADKKLYALRDVTGTVPSIPLIVASILSKKLAEGIDSLVLDVKWGTGAFMTTAEKAKELATTLVEVGHRMGKNTAAIITDMNQPLGRTAGNALEVIESVEALAGRGPDDLMEVTMALSAQMLILAGKAKDHVSALEQLNEKISNGEALARFKKMVRHQGGDPDSLDDYTKLPTAPIQQPFTARDSGYLVRVDAERVGRACAVLGAGRTKTTDQVDLAVGISELAKVGDRVAEGDPLAILHASDPDTLAAAIPYLDEAFEYTDQTITTYPLIVETVFPEGTRT